MRTGHPYALPTNHTIPPRRAEEEKNADIFEADHVALPDYIKDMRLKGLREKIKTVEGLIQVGGFPGNLTCLVPGLSIGPFTTPA